MRRKLFEKSFLRTSFKSFKQIKTLAGMSGEAPKEIVL